MQRAQNLDMQYLLSAIYYDMDHHGEFVCYNLKSTQIHLIFKTFNS